MDIILRINNDKECDDIKMILNNIEYVSSIAEINNIYECIDKIKNKAGCTLVFDTDGFKDSILEVFAAIKELNIPERNVNTVLIADKGDNSMTSMALRFGIDYVITRPYSIDDVVSKIIDIGVNDAVSKSKSEMQYKKIYIERMVSSILNSSGVLPNLKGYKYLKEAIVIGYTKRDVLEAVTKRLYPEIAKNNNTTADRVERSIRHAIESAWNKCGGNGFYSKMGFDKIYSSKRPTNSEYIFSVVEYLNNHAL